MTDITRSISIKNLVARRDRVAQEIRVASGLLIAANLTLNELDNQLPSEGECRSYLTLSHIIRPSHGYANLLGDKGAEEAIKMLDAQFWQLVMAASGMKTLMDAKAKGEWENSLTDGNYPVFTEENVHETFRQLRASRSDIFERGVLNSFRQLSWTYKTNLPVKFGKRIIVDYFCELNAGKYPHINYQTCNTLDDLVRVFSVLEDKPEPDHRCGILSQIRDNDYCVPGRQSFDYFDLKWFKKGSCHVTFTRPDLVDELNKIVAKHHPGALPASR